MREEKKEGEEGGGEKQRCSSSSLSQPPGTVCLRVEYEEPESSDVEVTQRRPSRRAMGKLAPA